MASLGLAVGYICLTYTQSVIDDLKSKGIRIVGDFRSEKLGYKIRAARLERIPYILVVGEEEEKNKTVSVRSRAKGDEGSILVDDFALRLLEEIASKSLDAVNVEVEL